MDWVPARLLGAAGGALVLLIFWHKCVANWREARRQSRHRQEAAPPMNMYVDIVADTLAGLTHVALGAAAGLMFHEQIIGVAAAIAVGASAPALLQQLGTARSVKEVVEGVGAELPTPEPVR
jgi:hypothetical protein